VKAILLCAGYATRLYPLTKDKPKPLLPVADRPILNYLLERLSHVSDTDRTFVITNEKFSAAFRAWQKGLGAAGAGVEVLSDGTTTNENRLGAIRDIAYVLKEKKVEDDILVLAGDNLFDFDLRHFVAQASRKRPHASIGVYDVQDLKLASRYGLVETASGGRITRFLEKPAQPTTTLASTGVYFFPREHRVFLDRYLASLENPDAPGHYISWLVSADQVFAFSFQGTWYDIGDFESYHKADESFRRLPQGKE
jgi:glucose-1-phosphate thymidylyltransferase